MLIGCTGLESSFVASHYENLVKSHNLPRYQLPSDQTGGWANQDDLRAQSFGNLHFSEFVIKLFSIISLKNTHTHIFIIYTYIKNDQTLTSYKAPLGTTNN